MRIAITEQKLDEFTNDDRSQRKRINELINTLDKTIKQTKKSRINKIDKNDVMEKLTKDVSKLVLITT
jgi:hypothetical protein